MNLSMRAMHYEVTISVIGLHHDMSPLAVST